MVSSKEVEGELTNEIRAQAACPPSKMMLWFSNTRLFRFEMAKNRCKYLLCLHKRTDSICGLGSFAVTAVEYRLDLSKTMIQQHFHPGKSRDRETCTDMVRRYIRWDCFVE